MAQALQEYQKWLINFNQNLTQEQKALFYTVCTVSLYSLYIIYKNIKAPKLPLRSVPVLDDKKRKDFSETAARRSVMSPKKLLDHVPAWPQAQNLGQLFSLLAKAFADRPCLGFRSLVKIHKEVKEVPTKVGGETKMVKKDWFFEERGPYQWFTFKEVDEKIQQLSAGLISIGLKPGSRLGIYCATRVEWMLIAQACFRSGITLVTVYANLGEEGLAYALQQGKLECLFTSSDLLAMVAKLKADLPSLATVVYVDKAKNEVLEQVADSGLKSLTFDELAAAGDDQEFDASQSAPEDLAIIMYTSGTTGPPKGVMLTHHNLISTVGGASTVVALNTSDVYIAALPLAHVLELVVELNVMSTGAAIGYGSPKTLTDALVKNCKGDLTELSPTLMAGVPMVWERIRKATLAKIDESSPIVKLIFWTAYKLRGYYLPIPLLQPILNLLVFNKFKQQLGGRMRIMLSGGAALSTETHEFMRRCFNVPFLQGYGLTETCGGSVILPPDHPGFGIAGAPFPCCELKLRDVPDMNYLATNQPHPQGEVCIRGNSVSVGYYEMEEKTAEDFDKDGWFYTGDIGEWKDDGTLAIIDRKKNLVKLSHGEYIAMEKMESKYKDSLLIENICVYGDSNRDYPVALVIPNKAALAKLGIDTSDSHALAANKEAAKTVLDSLVGVARKVNFKEIEVVKAVYLCPDEWTPENDMLTAAMKLQRAKICAKYKKELNALYA